MPELTPWTERTETENNHGYVEITKCSKADLWYAPHVGKVAALCRPEDSDPKCYWTREDAGFLNYIEKTDAVPYVETNTLQKAIAGALKSCIASHGPITYHFVGSATKRVNGAIKTYNREKREKSSPEDFLTG